jgi:hypothetical protein
MDIKYERQRTDSDQVNRRDRDHWNYCINICLII